MASAFLTIAFVAAVAAVYDIRTRRIPNWLVYPTVLAGPVLSLVFQKSTQYPTFIDSVVGLLGCFFLMFGYQAFTAIGSGDVKLAAAIGSLLGFSVGMTAIVYGYLIACLYAIAWGAMKTNLIPMFTQQVVGFTPMWVAMHFENRTVTEARGMEIPMAGFYFGGIVCTSILGPML